MYHIIGCKARLIENKEKFLNIRGRSVIIISTDIHVELDHILRCKTKQSRMKKKT